MKIKRHGYTVSLSDPILYVDNESRGRSGHMSHALAEYAPGKIMDFNSNCSAKRFEGHSTFGFIEYRTSEDGGETYSAIQKEHLQILSQKNKRNKQKFLTKEIMYGKMFP